MNKFLIIGMLCTATFSINAQILSEQELANVNSETIAAFDQMKRDSEVAFKGTSGFVTVGTDALNCDFTVIQNAVDANNSEIRIALGTYNENVEIDDMNIELLGGYSDCPAADNGTFNSSINATIKPNTGSGKPAILITGDSSRHSVKLKNLTLRDGELKGGLAILDADLGLIVEDSIIIFNKSSYGGGLSVRDGKTDIYTDNLQIIYNESGIVGGGLFCTGADNSILMTQTGTPIYSIAKNTVVGSTGNGGGAYIAGCTFTSYVGQDNGASGISDNEATNHGGGLYATSGAKIYLNGNRYCSFNPPTITCHGNNTQPVNLSGNTADSDEDENGEGGAIYALGSTTAVYGNNLRVNLNKAYKGGGVTATYGALFQTQTTYSNGFIGTVDKCWSKGRCNQFVGNKAFPHAAGGAFSADQGGKLIISRSHIEGNQAFVGAVVQTNNNSYFELEGSYVTSNGPYTALGNSYPMQFYYDSSVRIVNSTLADNNADSATIRNFNADVEIYSSIIHDITGVSAYFDQGSTTTTDCLIVNDLGDINDSTSIAADPEFVDRANNNYHLNAALSPAVDYCDNSQAQASGQDTDREDRGWNDYTVSNDYGAYDVGADESYGNDIIFEDGFE